MNAATKVLLLPELLEEILLYQKDYRFPFLAQRISLKEWFIDKRRRAALFHPRASWRRMLLANIPCPAKRVSYRWKSEKTSGQEISSSNNNNGMTMGEFIDYSVAFSCRFKIPRWDLENNLPSAYHNGNGDKCSWDLIIHGHADTYYGMTPNLWGVKTGRPALEDLINMEDLKIHIPAQNVEEYL
ncbi:hypothetical protein AnigIFM60653_001600 [Aspergillus niger]|nr:hypothetical protein AnigIFM60653_001600 [Aspergillus niger]